MHCIEESKSVSADESDSIKSKKKKTKPCATFIPNGESSSNDESNGHSTLQNGTLSNGSSAHTTNGTNGAHCQHEELPSEPLLLERFPQNGIFLIIMSVLLMNAI